MIVAASDDGANVRTAFGFALESEHYDLTVEIDPRDGTQSASHTLALIGLDTFSFDQRELIGDGSPQSVTFRVPPGTYSASALTFALAADEAREGVRDLRATSFVSTSDTKVVLDGDGARRFSYVTSRPASSDGQIMMVDWANARRGLRGPHPRRERRSRVRDARRLVGRRDVHVVSLNWMLSQPAGEVVPSSGDAVPVQSLAGPGQQPWDVAVPKLAGRYTVVDAGDASKVDASGAKRSIAIVSGSCEDLTGAARALAAAGAVAMVAYAGEGAECAGTVEQPSPLPAFQARPFDAARLLDRRASRHRSSRTTRRSTSTTSWALVRPRARRRCARRPSESRRDLRRAIRLSRRDDATGPPGLGHAPRLGARARCRSVRPRSSRVRAEQRQALREPDRRMGALGRGEERGRLRRRPRSRHRAMTCGRRKDDHRPLVRLAHHIQRLAAAREVRVAVVRRIARATSCGSLVLPWADDDGPRRRAALPRRVRRHSCTATVSSSAAEGKAIRVRPFGSVPALVTRSQQTMQPGKSPFSPTCRVRGARRGACHVRLVALNHFTT